MYLNIFYKACTPSENDTKTTEEDEKAGKKKKTMGLLYKNKVSFKPEGKKAKKVSFVVSIISMLKCFH